MTNKVKELLNEAINNVSVSFGADSVIGTPITAGDGTIIVPITRISYGFGGGGTDFAAKKEAAQGSFAGGIGGGASIKAEAFLVINDGNVRLITMNGENSPVDRIIDMLPFAVSKANDLITNLKNQKSGAAAQPEAAAPEGGEATNDNNQG